MPLSPRVIVAHPITENSSFFFNYGEFTQNPSYRYVYSKLNSISCESFPLQGNPNLNPQVSVNYEVGGKHQFLPTAAANVTFFVRDVYDYPSATRVDPISGTNLQSYFIYLNGHYARSKGFEIELEKRRSNNWAANMKKVVIATFPKDPWGTQVSHWCPSIKDVPKSAIKTEMSWSVDSVWKPVQNEPKRRLSS